MLRVYSISTFSAALVGVPKLSTITEWSMTRWHGTSGLIFCASPPSAVIASRIAARSTTQGTPVKSCISTRAGRYWISRSDVRSASHFYHRLEIVDGDGGAILEAQQIFEQHLHRERQARNIAERLGRLGEAVIRDLLAVDIERGTGGERVLADGGHGAAIPYMVRSIAARLSKGVVEGEGCGVRRAAIGIHTAQLQLAVAICSKAPYAPIQSATWPADLIGGVVERGGDRGGINARHRHAHRETARLERIDAAARDCAVERHHHRHAGPVEPEGRQLAGKARIGLDRERALIGHDATSLGGNRFRQELAEQLCRRSGPQRLLQISDGDRTIGDHHALRRERGDRAQSGDGGRRACRRSRVPGRPRAARWGESTINWGGVFGPKLIQPASGSAAIRPSRARRFALIITSPACNQAIWVRRSARSRRPCRAGPTAPTATRRSHPDRGRAD